MLVVVVGGSIDGAEGGHQIGERVFGGGAAAVSVDVDEGGAVARPIDERDRGLRAKRCFAVRRAVTQALVVV